MFRGKKKVLYISESEPARRNCFEEDDFYTQIVIDRVVEGQAIITTMDKELETTRSNSPIET